MIYIRLYIIVLLISLLLIAFSATKVKGYLNIVGVVILSIISSLPAIEALRGNATSFLYQGSPFTGTIPIKIDSLSGWFILIINFTFITSAIYGAKYMEVYPDKKSELNIHWISFLMTHAGLMTICSVGNSIVFLIAWEIMALSAFFLVIFESHKPQTIKAGINYLLQSHVAILFLSIGFIWAAIISKTFDFEGISYFASHQKPVFAFLLVLIFLTGFGIKAGFVPLHTWLPHAHPAAPSHVSAMMSGVLIKIGIYGILRIILLLQVNYLAVGYFILIISALTGVYGVMQAIVQHNLKRLLAYHSVENIGIIGLGIGLGCIGMGYENKTLAVLGFAGALLHTLNHSLFKSLLFFGAGNIHQSTHNMEIDRFGGLIKKMPQTAFLFLLASLAICGLPPFNGFISEFIIYTGFFNGINSTGLSAIIILSLALLALVLIGGLAIICFTKAFGTIFLGIPRFTINSHLQESNLQMLLPMYLIALMIIAIGIFPGVFIKALLAPLAQLTNISFNSLSIKPSSLEILDRLGFYLLGFILMVALIYFIRRLFVVNKPVEVDSTWGCGYIDPTPKIQYTASSFVRNYRKLSEKVLMFHKQKNEVKGIFPDKAWHRIHALDRTEEYLIKWPLRQFRKLLWRFSFLQNGRLQFYILYGMLFIMLAIGIPFVTQIIKQFVNYLNTL